MGTQVFNFSIPIIRDWFHFARKRLRQLTSSPAIDLNQVWETLHLQHKVYLPTASDLNNQDLRFDLAGVMHWDFMEEVGGDGFDAEDDRDELQMDDFANDWRDQFDADVVVGLVDANYAGGIFGVAYLPEIGPGGNPDFAHCIVEADAPAGRFTFTHEIAHLFRCRHDEDPGFANAVPFARGRIFDDINGVERITVMAQLGFGQRIQHFSNPNVNFNGVATGVVNERDNARQLGEIALDIADYDLGEPPLGTC